MNIAKLDFWCYKQRKYGYVFLRFLTLLLFSFFFEWGRVEHFRSLNNFAWTDVCIVICCFKCKGKIRIADIMNIMTKMCGELYVIRKYFLYTEF